MDKEKAIKSLLEYIKNILIYNLDNSNFLFITGKISPFDDYTISSNSRLRIVWHQDGELEKLDKPYRIYTHKYTRDFQLKGNIWFKSRKTKLLVDKKIDVELTVDAIINFEELEYTFEIMNEEKKLLNDFNNKVIETSKDNKLFGLDDPIIQIDQKGTSSFFTEILRKPRKNKFDYIDDFNVYNDLVRVSQDIRFLLGQLIMYKPHITNYLSGKSQFKGRTFFRYFPTRYDKRYFMTSGLIISLYYNYWDKIGDLLDLCFNA